MEKEIKYMFRYNGGRIYLTQYDSAPLFLLSPMQSRKIKVLRCYHVSGKFRTGYDFKEFFQGGEGYSWIFHITPNKIICTKLKSTFSIKGDIRDMVCEFSYQPDYMWCNSNILSKNLFTGKAFKITMMKTLNKKFHKAELALKRRKEKENFKKEMF